MLKRDVFSTIERGHYRTDDGEIEAVLRRIDDVPWWTFGLALRFLTRERPRACALAGLAWRRRFCLPAGARWCAAGSTASRCISPSRKGDGAYFRSAKAALRKLHRAGICHNDLAKEQNWLRGRRARLSHRFPARDALSPAAARCSASRAYEDLRHLLKHKRRYAPEALTAAERRVLARKSWITRAWMATGKKGLLRSSPAA